LSLPLRLCALGPEDLHRRCLRIVLILEQLSLALRSRRPLLLRLASLLVERRRLLRLALRPRLRRSAKRYTLEAHGEVSC